MIETIDSNPSVITYRLKGWELNVLLLESILFGAAAMAAVAWLVERWLPQVVGQATGFLVLLCALYPGIRVMTRRRGREVSFLPFLGLSLLAALLVAGGLFLWGGGLR
jgi:hypothetical protein